jgi:vacuolar-type H+-ATPase subunit C/Vma6
MSKEKKEKLILNTGDLSQAKVKSFVEREDIENKVVSRGRDITINQKR